MNSRLNVSKSKILKRRSSDVSALERRGYTFGKKIGKGSYGCVIKAAYKEDKSTEPCVELELACKYVDKSKAPKDFLQKFFPREIKILTQISHPNIIGIHSILQSGSTVFIFMRWAENGDLLDYVKNCGAIPEMQANLWFFQMVSAVKYIHSLNYAHRDLKCENILISKHMNMKIADFGFARKCVDDKDETIMSRTFCGSAGKQSNRILSTAKINFLTLFYSLRTTGNMQWNGLRSEEKRRLVTRNHSLYYAQRYHAIRR